MAAPKPSPSYMNAIGVPANANATASPASSMSVVGTRVEPSTSARESAAQIDSFLHRQLALPHGIAAQFKESVTAFPLRIWVIDNSGSMSTGDGHRLVRGADGRESMVRSSRWEELGESLSWHAQMAVKLGAPTEFRLLNPPVGMGLAQVVMCGVGGSAEAEVESVRKLVSTGPTGKTPLCAQIRAVTERVAAQAAALRATGQRCVVVIASDGAATDGDVEEAMRPLQQLPVWIVVRLCTDQAEVVKYWNSVDEDLELDMDVLDDLSGEAVEVRATNPWLTYARELHQLREWGTMHKLIDVLDERLLTVSEMRSMVELILGDAAADLPDPQLDWVRFASALQAALKTVHEVWCPVRKRRCAWFDASKMRNCYAKRGSCALM